MNLIDKSLARYFEPASIGAPEGTRCKGAMTMAAIEAVETIANRSVAQAPAVEFVTKRSSGRTVERAAHDRTGRDADTGNVRLAIAIRCRNNGLVRFDADLFKLDCDLGQEAITRLWGHWEFVNTKTPKQVRSRMEQHFSRNTIIFDATADQADDWREFLTEVLSDTASYVGID
jgi:hypothetical protein